MGLPENCMLWSPVGMPNAVCYFAWVETGQAPRSDSRLARNRPRLRKSRLAWARVSTIFAPPQGGVFCLHPPRSARYRKRTLEHV